MVPALNCWIAKAGIIKRDVSDVELINSRSRSRLSIYCKPTPVPPSFYFSLILLGFSSDDQLGRALELQAYFLTTCFGNLIRECCCFFCMPDTVTMYHLISR